MYNLHECRLFSVLAWGDRGKISCHTQMVQLSHSDASAGHPHDPEQTGRKLKIILDQKALVPNFVTLTAYCLEKVLWTDKTKNFILSFHLSKSCLTSCIYRSVFHFTHRSIKSGFWGCWPTYYYISYRQAVHWGPSIFTTKVRNHYWPT